MQFDRLSLNASPLRWLFRRLGVLLVFGLIHLLFVWNGDILTSYALAGFIVLPLLFVRSSVLSVVAFAFFILYAVGPILLYSVPWPDANTMQQHVASANHVYSTGTLSEIWRFSLRELPLMLSLHAFVFPRTVALFLFGALLWRSGILRQLHYRTYELAITATVGIVAGIASMAADAHGVPTKFGGVLVNVAPVALAIGYGAGILALTNLPVSGRLLSGFAQTGRTAFTNYLMQSVIFGFIFFGYGLGQFGRMDPAPVFALGVGVYAGQMLLSTWWLRRYRFGPVEWLWRTSTYGVAQPMRVVR